MRIHVRALVLAAVLVTAGCAVGGPAPGANPYGFLARATVPCGSLAIGRAILEADGSGSPLTGCSRGQLVRRGSALFAVSA